MAKELTVNPRKCVACHTCELVCSFSHFGESNPKNSRIKVVEFDDEGLFFPMICFQCEDAWCARTCPAAAIVRNEETGALEVLEDRCVGCRMCTLACPYGAILKTNVADTSFKCDLCKGDPSCVKLCPTGALKFEKVDSYQEEKQKISAGKLLQSLSRK
jgi:carbon-monoxide dehydrogenase iron sulfur subunit